MVRCLATLLLIIFGIGCQGSTGDSLELNQSGSGGVSTTPQTMQPPQLVADTKTPPQLIGGTMSPPTPLDDVGGTPPVDKPDRQPPPPSDMPTEMNTPAQGGPAFAMPILESDRHLINKTWIIGIDHGARSEDQTQCTNFDEQGFPFCYNGHKGTDFLVVGGFTTTDMTDVHVVAAASGTVIKVEDGHYDRCHGELSTGDVSCDGHPVVPNVVYVRHTEGWVTRYLHLKKDSITVNVGDVVECGQVLGRVGSSGWSSFPHLHFAVINALGRVTDPYGGSVTQQRSLWVGQTSDDGLPSAVCP